MTSYAKIASNRKNAASSTGPNTPRGKSKSKFNALTFGIHSMTRLLPGEDEGSYQELEKLYFEHFAPVDPIQETLVAEIVYLAWRLKRLERADFALFKLLRDAQVVRYLRFLPDD